MAGNEPKNIRLSAVRLRHCAIEAANIHSQIDCITFDYINLGINKLTKNKFYKKSDYVGFGLMNNICTVRKINQRF